MYYPLCPMPLAEMLFFVSANQAAALAISTAALLISESDLGIALKVDSTTALLNAMTWEKEE